MNELTVFHWVQFVSKTCPELETSKDFAERILSTVSRQYHNTAAKTQQEIISLLAVKKCIPTISGMHFPKEAYFPSVNLFDDLPILDFTQPKSINEAFLAALGVRKVSNTL